MWMRGQAAHISGEMAERRNGNASGRSARPITADSFRALMAKLGPRKDAAAQPRLAEIATQPAVEEVVVAAEDTLPVEVEAPQPVPVETKDYDWSRLFASPEPVVLPLQAAAEEAQDFEPVEITAPPTRPEPEKIDALDIEIEPSEPVPVEPPLPVITIDLNAVLDAPELEGADSSIR